MFAAAALEGEVVLCAAAVLVGLGHLDAVGVLVAGALGGAAGDNFYFYAFRGRLSRWLDRFPSLARRRELVVERVRRHGSKLALLSRFLPGLRISVPLACAYAGMSPLRFTSLNLASSFAWAGTVLFLVSRFGPDFLQKAGLRSGWAAALPAVLLVLFFLFLGRKPRSQVREIRP